MLFAIKNHAWASLTLLAGLILVCWPLHNALGLDWPLEPGAEAVLRFVWAAVAMGGSDGVLFGLFALVVGQPFLRCYRALVEFFAPQGRAAWLAGSLLAGGEELFFRGIVLEGLRGPLGWPVALLLSSFLFGLCHWIPRRSLWPFAAWAFWEGALLGAAYLWCGSLTLVVLLHVLHDLAGFAVFAVQRRTGWLLG